MIGSVQVQGKEYVLPGPLVLDNKNFIRIRITLNGQTERVWAYATEADKADYESDARDREMTRIAVLANDSLFGIPSGCIIPYKMVGQGVPTLLLENPLGFPMHDEYGEINIANLEDHWHTVNPQLVSNICYSYISYGWLKQKPEWESRINAVLLLLPQPTEQ